MGVLMSQKSRTNISGRSRRCDSRQGHESPSICGKVNVRSISYVAQSCWVRCLVLFTLAGVDHVGVNEEGGGAVAGGPWSQQGWVGGAQEGSGMHFACVLHALRVSTQPRPGSSAGAAGGAGGAPA